MGFDVNQATGARQRRVVRRGLVQGDVQKRPDAQRIGGAPRDCPFRVQPFKVAEQQQPEIPARRQTRSTDPVRVERRALCLHERIEPRLVEHPIQPLVKRCPALFGRSAVGTHIVACRVRPRLVPIAMPDSEGHRTDHVDPWNGGLSPRAASRVARDPPCSCPHRTDLRLDGHDLHVEPRRVLRIPVNHEEMPLRVLEMLRVVGDVVVHHRSGALVVRRRQWPALGTSPRHHDFDARLGCAGLRCFGQIPVPYVSKQLLAVEDAERDLVRIDNVVQHPHRAVAIVVLEDAAIECAHASHRQVIPGGSAPAAP